MAHAAARGWGPCRDTQTLWTYIQRAAPDDGHWLTVPRGHGVVLLAEGCAAPPRALRGAWRHLGVARVASSTAGTRLPSQQACALPCHGTRSLDAACTSAVILVKHSVSSHVHDTPNRFRRLHATAEAATAKGWPACAAPSGPGGLVWAPPPPLHLLCRERGGGGARSGGARPQALRELRGGAGVEKRAAPPCRPAARARMLPRGLTRGGRALRMEAADVATTRMSDITSQCHALRQTNPGAVEHVEVVDARLVALRGVWRGEEGEQALYEEALNIKAREWQGAVPRRAGLCNPPSV